ncbi:hypothetical protein [Natronorubrum aibiense]|uniref:Uncharacterized protein n=1 Tax=Natronorubrum aibiense TaxID=348826 RepID=A0A5P9NZW7_9EURY|nr:hypothetical protein [Natronorubrum aibiense]QFU81435.1 hypothetical protein GCU68_02115 [Natronorubrum aibiense]
MHGSLVLERVRSPRIAMFANLALVMTGSVLALLGVLDVITAVVIVGIGFAGVVISRMGHGDDHDGE